MQTKVIPWGKIEHPDPELTILLPAERQLLVKHWKDRVAITLKTPKQEAEESLFLTGPQGHVFLEPALPDLPLLLKPSRRLSILPGQTMKAYVEVPVSVRLFFQTKHKKDFLAEIPARTLSKSYFGNMDNGKLAYSLESPLHDSVLSYGSPSYSVYCPLVIMNKSAQPLLFERMLLQVPYLSLYEGKQRIYGKTVHIRFQGADQISQVNIQKGPPETEEALKFAAPPRRKEDKGLIRKSFYYIKTLYNT